jgi:hypothetical protein
LRHRLALFGSLSRERDQGGGLAGRRDGCTRRVGRPRGAHADSKRADECPQDGPKRDAWGSSEAPRSITSQVTWR